jgi:light-regulated signal transduction histidine kinase (bacteriophytochrome)
LEYVNKELEAFSYSVSHDLRSPLRIIDGYADMLATDYKSKLDKEGNQNISIIKESAQRMGQLIDDCLIFHIPAEKNW